MRLIRILYCECMSSQTPFNDKQLLPHVTSLSFVEAYYDINLNWTLNNCYGGVTRDRARPTFSQLWSFKIRRTKFQNDIQFYHLLISRLSNVELVGREIGQREKEKQRTINLCVLKNWFPTNPNCPVLWNSQTRRQKIQWLLSSFLYPKQLFESRQRRLKYWLLSNPTGPFTILEAEDQEMGGVYVVQELRATYFEVPKLRTERSGTYISWS